MKNLFAFIVEILTGAVAAYFGRHIWTAAKIEGVKLYLRGVAGARRLFLALLGLALCLFALCFGIILIHIGILFLLPGDIRVVAVLGLGIFYALVAGGLLVYCCREKAWMQASGAAKAMQSVLQDKR
jgi:hypothetical protein